MRKTSWLSRYVITGVVQRGDEAHLAALLPAPSVVQSDDFLLRSILLIQFHARISRLVIAAAPKAPPGRTPTLLVDPTAWFGREDVARVMSWKGGRIVGLEIRAELLAKSLPTVDPPPDDGVQDIHVPDWILARLRSSVERSPDLLGDRS